jgi:copper(I)-binding protein
MKNALLSTILAGLMLIVGGQAIVSVADAGAGPRDRLETRDVWVAEPLPGRDMSAAYLIIANEGDTDEVLVSVASDIAENIELHKMEHHDGMMRMMRVDSVDVPSNGEVELKPGGLHIMLIGLTRQIKAGDTVELTLHFESGATLSVDAPVKKR